MLTQLRKLPAWLQRLMGIQAFDGPTDAPTATETVVAARSTIAPWQQLSSTEAAAPRRYQRALRILLIVVLALFLFAGVRAAFGPRATTPAVNIPAAASFPQAAASGAAQRFATIYASWSQDAAQVRSNAMTTVWGGDPNTGWNGKGWQYATAPAVVVVSIDSAQLARVTVVLTVTSWTKDSRGKQSNITTRPMALQVPVSIGSDGTGRVAGVPVWVAIPAVAQPGTTTSNTETDNSLTTQTKAGAGAFFAAYGRDSDLSSLTAPGSTLAGLNGALTLGSVRQWTVNTAAGDTAQATAEVIWSTPNGATITQTYHVSLRRTISGDASRWQVLTLTA